MFCSKCGAENRDGSKFCSVCGALFNETAAEPAVQYAPPASQPEYQYNVMYGNPQGGMPVSTKKKKTGLMIGLIAGLLVLFGGAAALYFFVFAGTAVNGYWYSDETSMAFEFRDGGKAVQYSLMGKEEAGYEYNRQKGEGTLDLGGLKYDFTAEKDTLTFSEGGVKSEFKRADKDFDADAFIKKCNPLIGEWYDKAGICGKFTFENSGVVVLVTYGRMMAGTYISDKNSGTGKINLNGDSIYFKFSNNVLTVNGSEYTKNVVTQRGAADLYDDLKGLWYDEDGISGKLEFEANGTAVCIQNKRDYFSKAEYDPFERKGTITINNSNYKLTFLLTQDGELKVGDFVFVKEYVLQDSDDNGLVWYDSAGKKGMIVFYSGSNTIHFYDAASKQIIIGSYKFDNKSNTGTLYINSDGKVLDYSIGIKGKYLVFNNGEAYYTTDPVPQNK